MKKILEHLFLFVVFGLVYLVVELLWRGHTNLWMGLVGGFAGLIVGLLNNTLFSWNTSILLQSVVSMVIITFIEAVSGLILNIRMNLSIWDYSHMPLNFIQHQVCVPFMMAWLFLSILCIILDDYLRYWVFKEEKPSYVIFKKRGR